MWAIKLIILSFSKCPNGQKNYLRRWKGMLGVLQFYCNATEWLELSQIEFPRSDFCIPYPKTMEMHITFEISEKKRQKSKKSETNRCIRDKVLNHDLMVKWKKIFAAKWFVQVVRWSGSFDFWCRKCQHSFLCLRW